MSGYLGDVLQWLGIGSDTAGQIAPVLTDAAVGAGVGAAGAAITGGKPGMGALIGGGLGAVGGLATDFFSGSGGGVGANVTGTGTPASGAVSGFGGMPAAGTSGAGGGGAVPAPASVPIDPSVLGGTGFGGSAGPFGADGGASPFQSFATSSSGVDPFTAGGAAKASDGSAVSIPTQPGATTAGGWTVAPNASGTGIGGAFDSVSSFLKSNPWVIPAAGIGYELLNQPSLNSIPGYGQINTTANQLAAQGTQLQSYLQTGTLPPGVHESLNQAAQQAKAAIRSKYAASGQSGSSAEVADLANVDTTMSSQGATIAMQLLNSGVSESNLSAQLYSQIMNTALQQDQLLSQAIGSMAGAAARPTINLTGTTG